MWICSWIAIRLSLTLYVFLSLFLSHSLSHTLHFYHTLAHRLLHPLNVIPLSLSSILSTGLSVGRFHQHSAEVLDMEMSPVDYIQSKYQDKYPTNRLEGVSLHNSSPHSLPTFSALHFSTPSICRKTIFVDPFWSHVMFCCLSRR